GLGYAHPGELRSPARAAARRFAVRGGTSNSLAASSRAPAHKLATRAAPRPGGELDVRTSQVASRAPRPSPRGRARAVPSEVASEARSEPQVSEVDKAWWRGCAAPGPTKKWCPREGESLSGTGCCGGCRGGGRECCCCRTGRKLVGSYRELTAAVTF